MMNGLRNSLLIPIALMAAGCSTTVPPLEAEFPTPLIQNLPAVVGIVYDEDLRNFTYNETVSDGTSWTIELGTSNLRLFDRLFSAMFERVVTLESEKDAAGAGVDAVMRPILEEYAFLTPAELGSRFYAVSIRYRIILYDPDGNEMGNWPVNAYGQSRASAINAGRLRVGPLQNATNMAMRDAAAGAIITLRQQPELLALLEKEAPPDAPTAEN